jgi:hypothetical protein
MNRDCKILIVGSVPSKSCSQIGAPAGGRFGAGSEVDGENLYSSWVYVNYVMHYILADDRAKAYRPELASIGAVDHRFTL